MGAGIARTPNGIVGIMRPATSCRWEVIVKSAQTRQSPTGTRDFMMTFLGFGTCGDEVRSSGQHGRSPASPGAATGITHRPATIYATRNTHQRLSALSIVPTGSYLPYQCSLRPVPVVAVLTFRGAYFTFSIFTNPDSEDALCEVLQIDEIPALRTTDSPPSPVQKIRFRTASASELIPFESHAYSHLDISAKSRNQRDFQNNL